jgi:putative PIN family toxin of toxin-antitoxin system
MIRVVLDTNVVVSALLKPRGAEGSVLQLALGGVLRLCVSAPVLAEYEAVLPRPKLKIDPEIVEAALADIRTQGKLVRPRQTLSIASHEADNRFLECAEAAGADYIVTGNLRHFPKEWKGTRVVNARTVIELLA